jgi:hypothetical protein
MDKIGKILLEIKLIDSSPKLYLVNHFDMVRNQIDLDSERYLDTMKKLVKDQIQDWYLILKECVYQRQQEMIDEVDLFQEQCVSNLTSNPIGQMNLQEIECGLKNLRLDNQEMVLKFQRQLYCELHNRKKTLFLNKGMVYLNREFCAEALSCWINNEKDDFRFVLFGCLFLVEDEFLIYSDKLKEWSR